MNFLNSSSLGIKKRGWVLWDPPPTPNPSLFSALGICPDLELLVSSSADLWRWHMSCVGEDWGGSGGDKGAWSWSVAQSKSESAFVSKDGHVWPKTQTAPHPLISARKHLLGCWWVGEGWRRACCDVEEQHDGFKAALKFLGCREGRLHGGRTRERVKWNLSPDSPLVKPTWLKQSQAPSRSAL